MRDAIQAAYAWRFGVEPEFIFSGWGAELTEPERAVVENRAPVAPEPKLVTITLFQDGVEVGSFEGYIPSE